MRKLDTLLVVSLLAIPALLFLSGCQEKQASSGNTKMSKILAEENIQLKAELADCDKTISEKTKMLEQCAQEKADIQKKADEAIGFLMKQMDEQIKK